MEYIYVICPLVGLITCQLLKTIIETIETKKFDFSRLTNGSVGMPSSHTTFITSVTMLIGFKNGFTSPLFGLAFVLSGIILYDSMVVRYQSGLQAQAINNLNKINKVKTKPLRDKLGHTPIEVTVGFLYGSLIAYIFSLI